MPPRSDIVVGKFILVSEAEKLLIELPKNYPYEFNLCFFTSAPSCRECDGRSSSNFPALVLTIKSDPTFPLSNNQNTNLIIRLAKGKSHGCNVVLPGCKYYFTLVFFLKKNHLIGGVEV